MKSFLSKFSSDKVPLKTTKTASPTPPSEESKSIFPIAFMNKLKSKFSTQTQELTSTVTNFKNFAIFLGIGVFLIFLSLTFLPLLPISPYKFASLFTLGSISIIFSLGVLKGFTNFIKSLLVKEKIGFSLGYTASLLGTFWLAIIEKSFFGTIFMIAIQV